MTPDSSKQVKSPSMQPRQLAIVHLSDLHFGSKNRFIPSKTAAGDGPAREGTPTLIELLKRDLQDDNSECPAIICITGDIVQTPVFAAFDKAEGFVKELSKFSVLGSENSLDRIFIVPGNHDLNYKASSHGERWQLWTDFMNRLYGTQIDRDKPSEFIHVHDRVDDLGAIIVSLNSCLYIKKGTKDQNRGVVDLAQLKSVDDQLGQIPKDRLHSAIRIALIHHHPVLIPPLVEEGRGYDAVENSGQLLNLLRDYDFHLILHGHKHYPNFFRYDVTSPFHDANSVSPLFICAGGSAGSTELPNCAMDSTNCYNKIQIKWNPMARQVRVSVETRGLTIFDKVKNRPILAPNWKWERIATHDVHFVPDATSPMPATPDFRPFDDKRDRGPELERIQEYGRTGGYFPVLSVRPSLLPDQAYEACLWIVPHVSKRHPAKPKELSAVTWRAGRLFEVQRITREKDPRFCVQYEYWGPMLVQAELEFTDSTTCLEYIYVQMPQDNSSA